MAKTKHPELSFQQLFEAARDNAKRLFLESDNYEVAPLWHAISGDNENMLIMTPWYSNEEKAETVVGLRMLFAAAQVKRYAFICEAWTVHVPIGMDWREEMPPSQHPDRREVLRIMVEDRNGQRKSGSYFILRPEHGPPTLSPFHEDDPGWDFGGPMSGMLAPLPTEH